jgi:hypothetical protein
MPNSQLIKVLETSLGSHPLSPEEERDVPVMERYFNRFDKACKNLASRFILGLI